ncbi:MAG: hypothetical protein ACUZ8E_01090 [Candidatus Anammoxibacter sp.]
MKEIPTKLEKYLSKFDDNKRREKHDLFLLLYKRAKNNDIQSPRHWAMRQILSERTIKEIERRFSKLVIKTQKTLMRK